MDGWMGGRVEAKAGLRIAYSNQKLDTKQSSLVSQLGSFGFQIIQNPNEIIQISVSV